MTLKIWPPGRVTSSCDAGAAGGAPDRARGKRAAAEPDLVAGEPRSAVTGRPRYAASAALPRSSRPWRSKTAIGVADRVEGGLPLLLAGADEGVQPRVLHADRGLVGDDAEERARPRA